MRTRWWCLSMVLGAMLTPLVIVTTAIVQARLCPAPVGEYMGAKRVLNAILIGPSEAVRAALGRRGVVLGPLLDFRDPQNPITSMGLAFIYWALLGAVLGLAVAAIIHVRQRRRHRTSPVAAGGAPHQTVCNSPETPVHR